LVSPIYNETAKFKFVAHPIPNTTLIISVRNANNGFIVSSVNVGLFPSFTFLSFLYYKNLFLWNISIDPLILKLVSFILSRTKSILRFFRFISRCLFNISNTTCLITLGLKSIFSRIMRNFLK
jgi:hypothetical protein